jgi:hypothetical protein
MGVDAGDVEMSVTEEGHGFSESGVVGFSGSRGFTGSRFYSASLKF